MAAGRIVLPSYFPARDRNARLVSGALLTVYVDNTTTKAAIYSDIGLTTAIANPVEANSSGQFPAIFCDAGTVEVPVLYGLGVSGPDGASIGNPAIFYGWQPSVDGETAMAALAGQASEAAQAYYEDIVALEGIADDAIALATRAAKTANLSDLTDAAAARTNIGADLAANVNFTPAGTGAVNRTVQARLGDTVSVLDFIPVSLHAGIKAGTNTDDLTAYFQAAVVASASAATLSPTLALGHVYVPNGRYHITKVGIQGAVIRGQSREGTVLRAFSAGSAGDFMLDGMLERNGVTTTTEGTGWAENLSIEGTLPSLAVSGRSGLRTYGGGNHPHQLDIRSCSYGLACGLPIWQCIDNVYARSCNVGFYTFHDSAGDNGTSAVFIACWALDCTTYGFHITQLYYSQFIGCVSQEAGTHNFYLEGDANGNTACFSLMFIGCATEGSGTPFYLRRGREITIQNPRVIQPASGVDFIVLDDTYGTIQDFSTAGPPGAGKYHINANANAGFGAVLIIGGDVTYDPAFEEAFTRVGCGVNGSGQRTMSSHLGYRVKFNQVVGPRETGWTAATGTGSKGAYAAAAAGTASGAYVQAELQGALTRIAAAEARIVAYDAALRTHGLIGT